jgi:hypothetical protein
MAASCKVWMRRQSLPILSITGFFGNGTKTSRHGRTTTNRYERMRLKRAVLPESAAVAHLACRVLEEIVDVLMGLGLQSSFRLDALGNLDRRSQPHIRV